MKKAIYAGSFDIFTNGHLSVLNRALSIFDQVILLIAVSPTKSGLLDYDEREEILKKIFAGNDRIVVDHWSGLTAEYGRKNDVKFLIRGLRPTGDFDSEYMLARINRAINNEMESVFLMADNQTDYVSTSMVKEIWKHNGDITPFVPAVVLEYLEKHKS